MNAKTERKRSEEKEKETQEQKKKEKGKEKEKEKVQKKEKATSQESDSTRSGSDREQDQLSYDSAETCEVVCTLQEFVTARSSALEVSHFFEELRMHQLAKGFDHKVR